MSSKGNILVVDDDATLREYLCALIEDAGSLTHEASDGGEALEWLAKTDQLPQVIVLDLEMHGMDGATFRERQRADPRLRSIAVVLVSGRPDLLEVARRLDVAVAVKKPYDGEALVRRIQAIVFAIEDAERASLPPPRGRRVLAVFASDATRDAVAKTLAGPGCVVVTAFDGLDALEQAVYESIDLAVIDVDMPDLDGLATLDALRSARPGLAAILASKDATNGPRAVAKSAGFVLETERFLEELRLVVTAALAKLPRD